MRAARCALTVLLLGAAFLLTGCYAAMEGRSTGDMKSELTRSFLFQAAQMFYPDGVPDDHRELPALGAAQVELIQRTLDGRLQTIREIHARHAADLSRILKHTIPSETRLALTVSARGTPEAKTHADGSIVVDTRVVQAVFLAAVVNGQRAEIDLERIKARKHLTDPITAHEERLALETFLEMKRAVDTMPGRSAAGDLLGPTDMRNYREGGRGWWAINQLVTLLNQSALRFDSQLLFLLAHEMGHVVLNHFGETPLGITDRKTEGENADDPCARRRSLERAADVYAAFFLALATPANAVADLLGLAGEGFGHVSVAYGLDTFFQSAYDYAGFLTTATCFYPSPKHRRETVGQAYRLIRDAQIRGLLEHRPR